MVLIRAMWAEWFNPSYISAGTQFLLAFLGIFISLQEDWAKKHKVLVFLIFLIPAIVGVIASIQSERKTATAETDLKTSLGNINKSTKEIERLTALNTKLQERLLTSNKAITTLAQQSIDTTTGGDSFCYVFINNNQTYFTVVHQGNYPLYGVSARIVDVNKLSNDKLTRIERESALWGTTIFLGDLPPKAASPRPGQFPFSDSGRQDFNIFFSGRSGFWDQLLRWRLVDGKWVSAIKVYRYKEDKEGKQKPETVLERIDKNFPRNEKGEIEWN